MQQTTFRIKTCGLSLFDKHGARDNTVPSRLLGGRCNDYSERKYPVGATPTGEVPDGRVTAEEIVYSPW